MLGQDIPLVRQSLFTDGLFFLLLRKDKNNAKIKVLCLMIKKSMQFNNGMEGFSLLLDIDPFFETCTRTGGWSRKPEGEGNSN